MKRSFTRKLSYLVEVESALIIDDPLDIREPEKSTTEPVQRKSIRQKIYERLNGIGDPEPKIEDLEPKIENTFKVSVTQNPTQKIGAPATSSEIHYYGLSTLQVEMSYLQRHLKHGIEELIESLIEESRNMITTHEIPESEYEKLEDTLKIPDKFAVDKNKRIKKTLSKIETKMRQRMNPLKKRGRREKSIEKRSQEKNEAKEKIQEALKKLINHNERLSKAAVARVLGIGGRKYGTQSMKSWLETYEIDWNEEVAKAKQRNENLK